MESNDLMLFSFFPQSKGIIDITTYNMIGLVMSYCKRDELVLWVHFT